MTTISYERDVADFIPCSIAHGYVVTLNGNVVNNVIQADSTLGVVLFVNGLGKESLGVGDVKIIWKGVE